jgi:hypothetical protein
MHYDRKETTLPFSVKLPRRMIRNRSRVRFMFVDTPQTESLHARNQRMRFMDKLISILGFTQRHNKIELTNTFLHKVNQTPSWLCNVKHDRAALLALNLPYDHLFNPDFFQGSKIEFYYGNAAMAYIWLNDLWPQERHTITCICGLPDDECDDSCADCKMEIK